MQADPYIKRSSQTVILCIIFRDLLSTEDFFPQFFVWTPAIHHLL